MKHLRIALALAALSMANAAMATTSSYNLLTNQSSSTGGTGTSNGTVWNDTSLSAYGTNGTNYGNTYTWNAGVSGTNTQSLTLSAWGTAGSTASTTTALSKGWLGDYGSPNGFGVTSQSTGELNGSHDPDASSPYYQHAMDNYNAYESLLFSFGSKVTLNSVSIGFSAAAQGSTTDKNTNASIFEWIGSADPTSTLGNFSYSNMLCGLGGTGTSTNCWMLVGDLKNMSTSSSVLTGTNSMSGGNYTSVNAAIDSKYWMVGAYIPVGGNGADTSFSSFKVNGVTATTGLVTGQSVPEPASLALFGIAGVAFAASRRRARKV